MLGALSTQKLYLYTVVEWEVVAMGQGSTTEVTYFRLKQPPILPVDVTSLHAMATIIPW